MSELGGHATKIHCSRRSRAVDIIVSMAEKYGVFGGMIFKESFDEIEHTGIFVSGFPLPSCFIQPQNHRRDFLVTFHQNFQSFQSFVKNPKVFWLENSSFFFFLNKFAPLDPLFSHSIGVTPFSEKNSH